MFPNLFLILISVSNVIFQIHFGDCGKTYKRRYTRWFGDDGRQGSFIASYALKNYSKWEEKIEKWQKPIIDNPYAKKKNYDSNRDSN